MEKDYSFGIIPIKENKIFLVEHKKKQPFWSFPKGHKENNETNLETAERELKEETGLQLKKILFNNQTFKTNYIFKHKSGKWVEKTVEYWVAEVCGDIHLQKSEIQNGSWFNFSEVNEKLTYQEDKELFKKIYELFNK